MRNKKALSPIISYVILVTIVISTSLIVYPWLKTYVAVSPASCPDGVSVFLNKVNCSSNGENYLLNISVKNNGLFSIGGYFINFRNSDGRAISWDEGITFTELRQGHPWTGDIVQTDLKPGVSFIDSHSESGEQASLNPLKPDETIRSYFNVSKSISLDSIEIIPIRKEDKGKIVNCGKALTIEKVVCS